MFCPECGNRIEEGTRFCPECGTRVEFEDSCNTTENNAGSDGLEKKFSIGCIILTNTRLLAKAMQSSPEVITGLLQSFIEAKKDSGILYRLVDAGDYTFHKTSFFSSSRRVSLGTDSKSEDYMEVLTDVHRHDKARSQYLFIIGGNDVIPMPSIRHYLEGKDNDIDTDIIYAYPYGKDVLQLLESKELFKYDQQFMVGRLPFGTDASIDDLINYLERDISCSAGIPMTQAYGQCDPNWRNVSVKVAEGILPLMRNFDGRLSKEHYYNRIMLTPHVNDGNVMQVFNKEASLYYYNLHGSNAVNVRGYLGVAVGERVTQMAIQPEHMGSATQPNVVASEACYGARFIGLDKHHSMMLSSIHNMTMAYLGSSRIAWGCVDHPGITPSNAHISNADIMAKTFTLSLLQGYSTGQALFMARHAAIKNSKPGDLLSTVTVVEFNLFGDPTLYMCEAGRKQASKEIGSTALVEKDVDLQCKVTEISNKSTEGSLLGLVRSAVDENIAQIHENIGKLLYENFGLEPRPADSIFKVRYSDGSEEYNFKYETGNDELPMHYIVTSSKNGEITRINSSK